MSDEEAGLHHVPPGLLVPLLLLYQLPLVRFTLAAPAAAPPHTAPAPADHRWRGDREPPRQLTRHVPLEVVEHPVPPGPGQEVVLRPVLEAGAGGHRVVDPPQPRGHEVGEQDIDAVVTSDKRSIFCCRIAIMERKKN